MAGAVAGSGVYYSTLSSGEKIDAWAAIVTAVGVLFALYLPLRTEHSQSVEAARAKAERQKTTARLLENELAAVIRACDDKISDWDVRANKVKASVDLTRSGTKERMAILTSTVDVALYPEFDTFVFETIIRDVPALPEELQTRVFSTYSDLRLRGQPSQRQIQISVFPQCCKDAKVEIERLKNIAETTKISLHQYADGILSQS